MLENSLAFSKSVKDSDKVQEESYLVAQLIAKTIKPHTIAETMILSACSSVVKMMFGNETEEEVKNIPLWNSTISRHIYDMSADVDKCVQP
jgi:hypothetical protein